MALVVVWSCECGSSVSTSFCAAQRSGTACAGRGGEGAPNAIVRDRLMRARTDRDAFGKRDVGRQDMGGLR